MRLFKYNLIQNMGCPFALPNNFFGWYRPIRRRSRFGLKKFQEMPNVGPKGKDAEDCLARCLVGKPELQGNCRQKCFMLNKSSGASKSKFGKKSSLKRYMGRKVYTGPSGGKYTKVGGKKVYVPRKYRGLRRRKQRSRGGRSNVSKYRGLKKSVFCGPAGGAAKGSYPVNTQKRCRAALSYARFAKRPCGIIKCALRIAKAKGWKCGTTSKKAKKCLRRRSRFGFRYGFVRGRLSNKEIKAKAKRVAKDTAMLKSLGGYDKMWWHSHGILENGTKLHGSIASTGYPRAAKELVEGARRLSHFGEEDPYKKMREAYEAREKAKKAAKAPYDAKLKSLPAYKKFIKDHYHDILYPSGKKATSNIRSWKDSGVYTTTKGVGNKFGVSNPFKNLPAYKKLMDHQHPIYGWDSGGGEKQANDGNPV